MSAAKSTKPRVPSYRLHKASQQAVVTIQGKDHYLGVWQSPESRLKYERLITQVLAGEQASEPEASPGDCTIAELCVIYLRWATTHYVKDGEPTSELVNVKRAIRVLRECYAALPVRQFSPLKLKACRDRLIADGLCRSNVTRYQSIITRIIAYGVENELVPGETWHALKAVKPLQRGRSEARETDPIGPVTDAHVEATLPYLAEPYRTMVKLQGLLGCRPGELVNMRGAEIDRSEAVWIYSPTHHKTEHKSKSRVIPIGPQA
jgi:integrase